MFIYIKPEKFTVTVDTKLELVYDLTAVNTRVKGDDYF